MKRLSAFLLLVIVLGGGANVFRQRLFRPPSADATQYIFEVSEGQSLQKVSRSLEEQGFILNAKALLIYAKITNQGARLKVGEYKIAKNLSALEILEILTNGKSLNHYLTITEGQDIFDIANSIQQLGLASKQDFLQLVQNQDFASELLGETHPSLEGYLYPETYAFTKFTQISSLVEEMVKKTISTYNFSVKPYVPPGWSRHQVVTLASIIEKETGAPKERPLISSVFHNRLKIKMKLQTDPTVIYGLTLLNGERPFNIRKSDLLLPSPYNTYVIYGLPPGPISNPGRDSLLAAVKPQASRYLFFVSRNDGTHVFSESYTSHQKAVGQFQLNRKAREGKSWRDLKK